MNPEQEAIQRYYDDFAPEQSETGVNERLYECFKRIKQLGIKEAKHVLELGCGVGAFSGLLIKDLPTGVLEAIDLSPASIALAQSRMGASARFTAADILEYQPIASNFDFILLLDVIEHIPLEKHPVLWHQYAPLLVEGGKLVINLPNPEYLKWDQQQKPEQLQILDQPVPVLGLIQQLYQQGLSLLHFETYSVWSENDYHFIVFEKAKPYQEKLIRSQAPFFVKIKLKLWHYWLKWRYGS